MTLDITKLEKLLTQPDSQKKIVQFFQGASEADRKALSGFCIKHLKAQIKAEQEAWRGGNYKHNPLIEIASYAAHAASTPSQFDLGWRTFIEGDLVFQLLADRRPDWLDDWAVRCCRQLRVKNYPDIRRLILAGHCSTPQDDHFIRMMICSIDRNFKTPLEGLRKDPQLLEELIWRIFEVPYVMHNESMVGNLSNEWADALATLSKEKKLDRRRLFESAFSAVNMGFNREQVKVFLYLHDALQPSLPERKQMQPAYCGLLESNLPPVVKFSFETLKQLDRESPQNEQQLCEVLRAGMRSPTKAMVKGTLKWLEALIKRNQQCASAACLTATEGLLHEKPDVQADVWKFIEKTASPSAELAAELNRLHDAASASVKKQIKQWLQEHSEVEVPENKEAGQSDAASLKEAIALARKVKKPLAALLGIPQLLAAIKNNSPRIPPCTFNGTELSRLAGAEALPPIESLEELVEIAALVLEDGSLVDDAERVLEALTRFPVAGEAAALKTADPIIKRARKRAARIAAFHGAGADHDLVPVIEAWSGQEKRCAELQQEYSRREERDSPPPPGLTGFLAHRSKGVMKRFLEKKPLVLLAAPTHRGSWIDPAILAVRLKTVKEQQHLLDYDQVLALLRLAPDNRKKALKAAKNLPGEFAAAFRYACGDETKKIGKTHYLWVAAARARSPFDDDPLVEKKFPNLGADAGLAAKYHVRDSGKKKKRLWEVSALLYSEDSPLPRFDHQGWKNSPKVDYLLPTTLPHEHAVHSDVFADTMPCVPQIFDLAASVWPLQRESYFLPQAHVKPLFDENTPLLEMSSWGLVRALGEDWLPHRALGMDAAIAAIEDGRFDAARIGRMLAVETYFAHRHAKTLPEVAAVSLLHALQIAQTLIEMLANQPVHRTAGFGALLDILYELLEELQIKVENPAAIKYLQSIGGSSKAAKNAMRILAFTPLSTPDFSPIYEQALRGRLQANRQFAV